MLGLGSGFPWVPVDLRGWIRRQLVRHFLGESRIVLERRIPSLEDAFDRTEMIGLYLHIPFCRQICLYCPYSKELYRPGVSRPYVDAVKREIDIYSDLAAGRPVTSFYIGGGTPTTMLHEGLGEILEHVFSRFTMRCGIHMESHPNDLSADNLDLIAHLGVENLSIGVEALQDHHLAVLQRPYNADQARGAVRRAAAKGFKCVNADIIFGLPGQTCAELEDAGRDLTGMGIDQVAAYPLFDFPYTGWSDLVTEGRLKTPGPLKRRRMLRVLEGLLYGAGFERTSVWAFTRRGIPGYCSVTVPLYVGLGAGGASYLRDRFHLNTFSVREYTRALAGGGTPIALSIDLSEEMQMASWLYWRIYETRFAKRDFQARFGKAFDNVYGRHIAALQLVGLVERNDEEVVLSDAGAYWLHALQDLLSLDYIGKLWGRSQRVPWPEGVVLQEG